MDNVHKEAVTTIENCLPNRNELDREIFAMEGIPEDIKEQHRQRVLTQYYEEQAERRAATGNPTPGSAESSAPKKAKTEEKGDLKKRLAEFKAKRAQAQQSGPASDGASTPTGAGQAPQPPESGSPPIQLVCSRPNWCISSISLTPQ